MNVVHWMKGIGVEFLVALHSICMMARRCITREYSMSKSRQPIRLLMVIIRSDPDLIISRNLDLAEYVAVRAISYFYKRVQRNENDLVM